jgi:hypothetical protein
MQNQTVGQVQPNLHAPQPAVDGMAIAHRGSFDIRELATGPVEPASPPASERLNDRDRRPAA